MGKARYAYMPIDPIVCLLTKTICLFSSPWQPEFCNWAFNLPRGEKLLEKWRLIPSDTDVLVTHTPPFGRGDKVGYLNVGCEELTREVTERIQPQFHVFGHVHEGYGKSSDGVTVYMNASACTHDYEAINPAFVFDLTVAKSRITTTAVSRQDVVESSAETSKVLGYALMLHEQLRVCSQKAPFIPNPFVRGTSEEEKQNGDSPARRKHSLREFRVDGTTSGLLLESTLKLRPVVGEQTRALRYLFHNGMNTGPAPGMNGGDARVVDVASHSEKEGDEDTTAQESSASRAARRRQATILRRVTMAVLNDVSESKELTVVEIQELESSALTLTSSSDASDSNGSVKSSVTGRVRRNKTLQRREGRVRLASMPEESEEKQQSQLEVNLEPVVPAAPVEDPVEPPPPAAPVVECVLCKYKVSGHIHPGSVAAEVVERPPAAATANGSLTQSSEDAVVEQKEQSTESERQKTMSAKRLSSWF